MNCESGDLARVIDHPHTRACGIVDLILRVGDECVALDGVYGRYWSIDPINCRCRVGCTEVLDCCADNLLRPIRDPGDDAIDWASRRTPRSVDLQADQFARARAQLQEIQS